MGVSVEEEGDQKKKDVVNLVCGSCKEFCEAANHRKEELVLEELVLEENAWVSWRQWVWFGVKVVAWMVVACLVAGVLVLKGIPLLLSKVIIPVLEWEASTFSRPALAVVIFISLALSHAVFLPQGPSVWLTGIIFGFKQGFPLVLIGIGVGFTIPFFIGRLLLQEQMQAWVSKVPRHRQMRQLAEYGDWWHQFKVVFLMRVSPVPSPLFNYLVTVTSIQYGPYIAASLASGAPEAAVNLYSGVLLKSLADFEHHTVKPNKIELICNALGLTIAVVVAIGVMMYARKALREMEEEGKLIDELPAYAVLPRMEAAERLAKMAEGRSELEHHSDVHGSPANIHSDDANVSYAVVVAEASIAEPTAQIEGDGDTALAQPLLHDPEKKSVWNVIPNIYLKMFPKNA